MFQQRHFIALASFVGNERQVSLERLSDSEFAMFVHRLGNLMIEHNFRFKRDVFNDAVAECTDDRRWTETT